MFRARFPQRGSDEARTQFVIAPHHPDRLRRPVPAPASTERERFHQALTWNVFRTLELLTPSFWLRRLHVRLTGEASVLAPQIVHVQLWRTWPLPPIQRIDGSRPEILAHVTIETEHAVWMLGTSPDRASVDDGEQAAAIVDAGTWLAGARDLHCGAIEPIEAIEAIQAIEAIDALDPRDARLSPGALLERRYARSSASARLRSATRGPAAPSSTMTWGALQWIDLAEVLLDGSEAPIVPPIERALARNALDWLEAVGVQPANVTQRERRLL